MRIIINRFCIASVIALAFGGTMSASAEVAVKGDWGKAQFYAISAKLVRRFSLLITANY